MDDRVDGLLATIEQAHREVAAAITALSSDRVLDHVAGRWTRKDVIAHLAWWHDHSIFVLTELSAGRVPYDRDDVSMTTDAMNATSHAEHADQPLERSIADEADSYRRLLEALRAADPDALFDPARYPWTRGEPLVDTVRWDTDRHYADHLEHLRV